MVNETMENHLKENVALNRQEYEMEEKNPNNLYEK